MFTYEIPSDYYVNLCIAKPPRTIQTFLVNNVHLMFRSYEMISVVINEIS